VYCIDYSGNEKILAFREEKHFLAGYSPFIENKEIWYSIQALETSEVIWTLIITKDWKNLLLVGMR